MFLNLFGSSFSTSWLLRFMMILRYSMGWFRKERDSVVLKRVRDIAFEFINKILIVELISSLSSEQDKEKE